MSTHRYDAKKIVDRANELGVVLSAESDRIKVKIPKGLESQNILNVVKDHKGELLSYLRDCCLCGTHLDQDTGIGGYTEFGHYVCSTCVIQQQRKPVTIITGRAIPAFIEDYTSRLVPGTLVALDCETTGLDRYRHKLVTVQIGVPGETYILDVRPFYFLATTERPAFCRAFQKLFSSPVIWLGHNLKFDWLFLAQHFHIRPGETYDTMIAEKALNEGRSVKYGMKETGERYGLEISKEQQMATVDLDKSTA